MSRPVILPTSHPVVPSTVRNEVEASSSGLSDVGQASSATVPDVFDAGVSTPAVRASATLPPSPADWRETLDFSQGPDPFMRQDSSAPWTKFTLLRDEPQRVLFQNANALEFHFDFARRFIPAFAGMTRAEFDAATIDGGDNRKALLGALIGTPPQLGLQLISRTPLDVQTVLSALTRAKQSINAPGTKFVYYPTLEQQQAAQGYAQALAAAGFELGNPVPAQGNEVHSPGWAIGRLTFVTASEIAKQYASGALLPSDILVTDGVPAEVPNVAGIVSLRQATPNSHVAILAQSYKAPFAYVQEKALVERLRALNGQSVLLEARSFMGVASSVSLAPVGDLSSAMLNQLRELRKAAPLEFPAKQRLGRWGLPIDAISHDAAAFFGGKVANYTLLRAALPEENVPKAVAFSFDLWDAVMDLSVPSTEQPGASVKLRDEIAFRLKPFASYPPLDMLAAQQALDGIRKLIRKIDLPPPLKDGIKQLLIGPSGTQKPTFDPATPMRFRSSTNVEDGDTFTGAGLYDSYTGVLATDLGTGGGGKRGAYEAVLRTLASFYNDNAYLERVRRGVDEQKVGMAILAHASYPDETERANGVATMKLDDFSVETRIVSQVGADSITNPDETSPTAEDVVISGPRDNSFPPYVNQRKASSHPKLRLGETVMDFPRDYERFNSLFLKAAEEYIKKRGTPLPVTFDFEYKKTIVDPADRTKDSLIIKQVRVVPKPQGVQPVAVLPETLVLETAQTEFGDVFSNHAAKSRWTVKTKERWLAGASADLASSLFETVELEYVEDGRVKRWSGPLGSLSGYAQSGDESPPDAVKLSERWQDGIGTHTLEAVLPKALPEPNAPIVRLSESAENSVQCPIWNTALSQPIWAITDTYDGSGQSRRVHATQAQTTTLLQPRRPAADQVQTRFNFAAPKAGLAGADVQVSPRYRYALPLSAFEKTRGLASWEKSTITGLTSRPIELSGFFSQTMRPGHHNFQEEFIFEPRLEPGMDSSTLKELEAQDIIAIYAASDGSLHVSGKNGQWRALTTPAS
jgi:Pyruvate phosphate dikinase, AMP/ATP-binding domain